jgi:hypothetical protein
MRKFVFAFAAASALPLVSVASAQAPASIDLDAVQPISGTWAYAAIPGGSEAAFADAAGKRRLVLRCNRPARTVSIVRSDVPAATATLSIWTSSIARSVPSRFLPSQELVADLTATDALLDAIAFSRGRIGTAAAGAPMVALPVAPEATRVIEDCRG